MTIKVDLLPTERRGFRLDPMVIVLFLLVVICTVGFAYYGQTLQQEIDSTKKEVEKVNAEIKEKQQSLPVIEERRRKIAKLQEQIEIIKSLVHDPQRYANLLQEVGIMLPPNVWLSSLSIEPGSSTIAFGGTALETPGRLPLATIALLMKNLNDSKYFRDANLASTTGATVAGVTSFTFQMSVRYDAQAAATLPPTGTPGSSSTTTTNTTTNTTTGAPTPDGASGTPAPAATP